MAIDDKNKFVTLNSWDTELKPRIIEGIEIGEMASDQAEGYRDEAAQFATTATNSATSATTSATTATNAATAATTAKDDAEDARDASQTARDQAVAAKDDAETARDQAVTAKDDAEDARDKASEWSDKAEDSPVETSPDRFSALHHASKAESFASQAEGFRNDAETAAGLSIQGIKVIGRLADEQALPGSPDPGDAYVIEISGSDIIYVYTGSDWASFDVGSGTSWGQIVGSITNQTDLSNALNSKLTASDIADFETTSQLNDRDTANRNRTNHTGTQAISTVDGLQTELDGKEPTFSKNSAFNKNFGTASDTVTQGNDSRLSDSREWTADTVSQAEAEAGTATTRRAWTAERVRQAIVAWWNGSTDKTKLDGIEAGAQVNRVSITAKSAAWTLSMSEGDYYRYTGASAVDATVPQNSSVAFPIGSVITIWQAGAGVVTATEDTNVTINGDVKTADQYKAIQLVKVDTNTWDCIGGVA